MVCPRTRVVDYRDAPVTHFVSLLDPDEVGKELPVPRAADRKLQLVFSDLDDIEMKLPKFKNYTAPTTDDVAKMVEFGRTLSHIDDWGLLAHCEAGISRSTAAAITMLTAAGYPPDMSFDLVRHVCPEMLPNRRILRLADGMLGTGGYLHQIAETHRKEMFQLAGYEDPTNVLWSEFLAEQSRPKSIFDRLIRFLPGSWRNMVGSGARQRAALEKKGSKPGPKGPVPRAV
ncbi:MAG: hypothetical protein Fur0032_21380 [Terrimicrobiaceae bacterium]